MELTNEVHDIISARCSMCHAREPLWDGYLNAPNGFVIESKEDIIKHAKKVYLHSAISRAMPPNNISYMEEIEDLLFNIGMKIKTKMINSLKLISIRVEKLHSINLIFFYCVLSFFDRSQSKKTFESSIFVLGHFCGLTSIAPY